MFKVIRIPTKYSRTIQRFTQKEKSELLEALIQIGAGNPVTVSDNIVGDTISLIYGDWMNMESKNGNKSGESLIRYSSGLPGQITPSDPAPIVKYSEIKESKVKYSEEIVETKVSHPLKSLMLEKLNKQIFASEYNSTEENIKKEMLEFYYYWSEKNPNGKKERWQMEKTFDINLRFRKWLKNSNKWDKGTNEESERQRKLKELEEERKNLFNK